jgi:hypothetical protein
MARAAFPSDHRHRFFQSHFINAWLEFVDESDPSMKRAVTLQQAVFAMESFMRQPMDGQYRRDLWANGFVPVSSSSSNGRGGDDDAANWRRMTNRGSALGDHLFLEYVDSIDMSNGVFSLNLLPLSKLNRTSLTRSMRAVMQREADRASSPLAMPIDNINPSPPLGTAVVATPLSSDVASNSSDITSATVATTDLTRRLMDARV